MRIFQKNDSRVKKAAKVVSCGVSHICHSKILDGLAFGLGYLDWFDFSKCFFDEQPSPLDQELSEAAFRERQVDLICRISTELDVRDELIQYLLSGTRLTGDRKWTLDDHLAIRWMSWLRLDLLFVPNSPIGSLVGVTDSGREHEAGFLVNDGGANRIMFPDGEKLRATTETSIAPSGVTPFVPYSHYVPYVVRYFDDYEILFSRERTPMWRIDMDGRVKRMKPWEDWSGKYTEKYFKDETGKWAFHPETRAQAMRYVEMRGVKGLPVIADATPALIRIGDASDDAIPKALKAYHERGTSFTPTKDKFDALIENGRHSENDFLVVERGDWPRLLAETGCTELSTRNMLPRGEIEYRGVRLFKKREQRL